MAPVNVITGLTRRKARNKLPRKKRSSLSYTCTEKLLARNAMEAFETYMIGTKVLLTAYAALESDPSLDSDEISSIKSFLLGSSLCFYNGAKEMLKLDSLLMDVQPEIEESAGFLKEQQYVSLESFSNNDECQDKTRFTKTEIRALINHLDFA